MLRMLCQYIFSHDSFVQSFQGGTIYAWVVYIKSSIQDDLNYNFLFSEFSVVMWKKEPISQFYLII